MPNKKLSLIAGIAFLQAVPHASAQNKSVVGAMALISQEKRNEGFKILEDLFARSSKIDEKARAAKILTTAFDGELAMSPGFYAEFLIKSFPQNPLAERTRWMRLAGDYFLSRNKLDEAQARYQSLENEGGSEDKEFARYKLAWVAVNRGDSQQALSRLTQLVSDQKSTQLRSAAAFDLGRFWGEVDAKNRGKPDELAKTVLKDSNLGNEFFRGLQKSLLLPKKSSDRSALRATIAQLPGFEKIIEEDLAKATLGPDISCEKLEWADHLKQPMTLKYAKLTPAITDCLEDRLARKTKDEKSRERAHKLLQMSVVESPEEQLARTKVLAALGDYPRACDDALVSVANSTSTDEALSFCTEAYKNSKPYMATMDKVVALALKAPIKENLSVFLHEVYAKQFEAFEKEARREALTTRFAGTPIAELMYDEAQAKGRKDFVDFVATEWLKPEGSNAQTLATHILSKKDGDKDIARDLERHFPLAGDMKAIATQKALPVWLAAYAKQSAATPVRYAALDALCAQVAESPIKNRRDFWIYCLDKNPLSLSWSVATQLKLSCADSSSLWALTWNQSLSDKAPLKHSSATFQKAVGEFRAQNSAKALLTLQKSCPSLKKHPLFDELSIAALAQKTAQQKKVKDIEKVAPRLDLIKKTYTAIKGRSAWLSSAIQSQSKNQFVASLNSFDADLGALIQSTPAVQSQLEQVKTLLRQWKESL